MPIHPLAETSAARTPREDREVASWLSVVRAYQECARRYASMLEHFDLTTSQFDALAAIQALGDEALPKAVAERLLVTRANVSGLLRRLHERGLIEMAPHDTDGRSVRCALTRQGRTLTELAQTAAGRFVRAQLAPFPTDELDVLEGQMRAMYAHLQTLDPEALATAEEPAGTYLSPTSQLSETRT